MRNPTTLIRLGAIFVLTSLAAYGQAVKTITANFQTIGVGGPISGVYYRPAPTSAPVALNVPQNKTSTQSYNYSGPAVMDLLVVDNNASANDGSTPAPSAGTAAGSGRRGQGQNGNRKFKVAGKVAFPANGNYTVYISPGGDGYNGAAIAGAGKGFPGGSFAFINATGLPLQVQITDDKGAVVATKPLAIGAATVVPITKSAVFHFTRTDKKNPDGTFQEIQSANGDYNPRTATSVILMPDLSISTLNSDPNAAAAGASGSASGERGSGGRGSGGGSGRRNNGGGNGG